MMKKNKVSISFITFYVILTVSLFIMIAGYRSEILIIGGMGLYIFGLLFGTWITLRPITKRGRREKHVINVGKVHIRGLQIQK